MARDPGETWEEYGNRMRPQRVKEWNALPAKKKEKALKMLDEILGDGWEDRVKDWERIGR